MPVVRGRVANGSGPPVSASCRPAYARAISQLLTGGWQAFCWRRRADVNVTIGGPGAAHRTPARTPTKSLPFELETIWWQAMQLEGASCR
jgi:hypothetical protein